MRQCAFSRRPFDKTSHLTATMWRLAVVAVLVAMRTEGAQISLPDLGGEVGVLTWPVRFALWGLAPLAEDHGIELEDLRVRLEPAEAGRSPHPCTGSFHIYQAAEEGVIETLKGDVHGCGGPWPCKLRVEAHVEGRDPLVLPLSSPPFLLHVPNPDTGDHEGRHWLDQAADLRGAPDGSAEGSKKDNNGPDDGPDPPWWFASYVILHESIRQGRRPARYVVWTCSSLLGEAAPGMHGTSAPKDAAWRTGDIFNAPSHVGPRPSRFARDGDYLGCAGYGNRLYGIGTALLYALVTGKLTPHSCSSERLSV
jgi:hypothetical protein